MPNIKFIGGGNTGNIKKSNGFGDETNIKEKSLFARLKRLFSTDVVVRNIGGKKLKIKDTDSIMYATDRNSLRDRFNRVRSTAYNAYTRDFSLSYQSARIDLFRDYDTIDMDAIMSAALDIYADETTTKNEINEILTIKAKNNNIKEILHNLFYDILNVEFNLWSWVRNVCKYGDFYLKLHISPEYGIYLVEPISAYNVERIENTDPANKNYVKFQVRPTDTSQIESLENFEVAHFRLLSDSNFIPYGRSMLEPARRTWKQLSLLEDAMLLHRIMRAPERRVFKVDIGNIPPQEVDNYMEKLMAKMKKVPYMDQTTGEYNLRMNLQTSIEDYFLPVRGSDSGTSIETLPGMEYTGIDDIEYVKNKMLAALKIPKAFLGFDENIGGKSNLAMEDVRFGRTIQRIQKVVVSELTKIGIIHLYAQGYRDENLVDFSLELTNPSTIFEKEKLEIWSDKTDLAKNMIEQKLFSRKWIYSNVYNLSDDDRDEISNDIVEDTKQAWRFKSIEDEGYDPAKPFEKINAKREGGEGAPIGGKPDLKGGDKMESEMPVSKELPGKGELSKISQSSPMKENTKNIINGEPEIVVVKEKHGEHADDYERPSQAGNKKASDYPFGEDPLGDKEIRRRPRKKSIIDTPTSSPLTLEHVLGSNMLETLGKFLNTRGAKEEKKQLLENANNKSLLDESNIL
jgi:hypothetical protein